MFVDIMEVMGARRTQGVRKSIILANVFIGDPDRGRLRHHCIDHRRYPPQGSVRVMGMLFRGAHRQFPELLP